MLIPFMVLTIWNFKKIVSFITYSADKNQDGRVDFTVEFIPVMGSIVLNVIGLIDIIHDGQISDWFVTILALQFISAAVIVAIMQAKAKVPELPRDTPPDLNEKI